MPEHVTLNLTQVGAILAACGLTWGVVKKVVPALRRLGHLLDALVGVPEDGRPSIVSKVDTLAETLELVRKQVYPNGGASLPDRVGQLADGQLALTTQVHELANAQQSLAASQVQKAAAIEALTDRFGAVESRIATIHHDTKPDPGGTP